MTKSLRPVVFAAFVLVFTNVPAAFARDIVCQFADGVPTVNGIRSLEYHQDDWHGAGEVTIRRDSAVEPEVSHASFSNENDLHWGEGSFQSPGLNYAVRDAVFLRKTTDALHGKIFVLMKVRTTLSGPNCDGFHGCGANSRTIEEAVIPCTDTHDLIRVDTTPRCDRLIPYDCD